MQLSTLVRRTVRQPLSLLSIALLAGACADSPLPTDVSSATPRNEAAKQISPRDTATRYIVRLKEDREDVSARAERLVGGYGGRVDLTFRKVFQGFVVANLSAEAASQLARNPSVEYIEKEGMSHVTGVQTLTETSQWGLDHIDQSFHSLDNEYTYVYTGVGTHIYIVDTGVRGGHSEFTGRIGNGTCKISWSWGCSPTIDAHGHGTAVASIAAGTYAGVAKDAMIHSVRVSDDGGLSNGDLIDGLEWVIGNHIDPAVVSMSIGVTNCNDPGSFALRDALQSVVDVGIVLAQAAGNCNADAYTYRANRVSPSFVVGAAEWVFGQLYRAGYSNFGATVDLFAPELVYAAAIASNNAYRTDMDGTSAATPFVAGAAAQILEAYPYLTPSEVDYWIKANSFSGIMNGSGLGAGSPNLFLSRW